MASVARRRLHTVAQRSVMADSGRNVPGNQREEDTFFAEATGSIRGLQTFIIILLKAVSTRAGQQLSVIYDTTRVYLATQFQ